MFKLIGDDDDLDDNDDDYLIMTIFTPLVFFRWWLRSKCWCRCLWSDDSNWETGSRLHITHHDDKQRNACLCDNPKWKDISIAAGASRSVVRRCNSLSHPHHDVGDNASDHHLTNIITVIITTIIIITSNTIITTIINHHQNHQSHQSHISISISINCDQIASNAATTSMLVPVIKTLAIKLQVTLTWFLFDPLNPMI